MADRDPQPAQEPKHPGDPSQGQYLLNEWSRIITEKKAEPPVILHSCHVACSASYFSGPTLQVQICNASGAPPLLPSVAYKLPRCVCVLIRMAMHRPAPAL